MKQRHGFTLIELLIVMFIIGVLTMVIILNFDRGDKSQDLRSVTTEFVQAVRLAQTYATGGNSLDYCGLGSTQNNYARCLDDAYCGGGAGSCVNGVPLGGYGVYIETSFTYRLFANTNTIAGYYDGDEPEIVVENTLDTNVGILQYGFGSAQVTPESAPLSIVFAPPTGVISFYSGTAEITEAEVSILIKSSYIEDVCRTITINKISNQINERQTGCSL